MKYLKLVLVIILLIPITGCYNYRELDDLGITTAIGVTKENNEYKLIIEVLRTEGESDEATEPQYVLFETKGKTIQEALRNTILESSKRLYINHLSLLIIDETLAKEGIHDIMDLFFRDSESRKQFYVLVSKVPINELLNTKTLLTNINSKSIFERMKTNDDYLNNVVTITFSKLLTKYVNPNKELVIPSITLEENNITEENEKRIILSDTAIFKDDKLIGYLNNDETLYYNLIEDEVDDTVISIEDNDKYSSVEMNFNNTIIDVNNKDINIRIEMFGNIAEMNYDIDLTNPNSITYLEKLYENYLNIEISKIIHKVINEYDTDIFGFKDLIYKNDFKNFNTNIKLKDLNIIVDTKISIKSKGNGVYKLNER